MEGEEGSGKEKMHVDNNENLGKHEQRYPFLPLHGCSFNNALASHKHWFELQSQDLFLVRCMTALTSKQTFPF